MSKLNQMFLDKLNEMLEGFPVSSMSKHDEITLKGIIEAKVRQGIRAGDVALDFDIDYIHSGKYLQVVNKEIKNTLDDEDVF